MSSMKRILICTTGLIAFSSNGGIAQYATAAAQTAQNVAQAGGIPEVIVTARRREESDLKVPVAIAVMSSADLQRRGITNFRDIGQATPGLIVTDSQNFGGAVALRGIGAASTNTTADQSVLFTIDQVSLSNANAIRFSQFDLDRVEVLKGPQALFYGKNASAGIISVTTANPTKELYLMGRVGYDFNARGLTTEAVASGPVADTLGARIAFFRDSQEGYFTIPSAAGLTSQFGVPLGPPSYKRAQDYTLMGVRGTLMFEPSDAFTMKAKFSYGNRRGASPFTGEQLFYCPLGVPNPNNPANTPGEQNCKVDTVAAAQGAGVYSPTFPALFKNTKPYLSADQYLASLDASYKINDALTLNSITSYYDFKDLGWGNTTAAAFQAIEVGTDQDKWDFTQELRLSSNFTNSRVNFMVGGYYQKGTYDQFIPPILFGAFELPGSRYVVKSETKAAFGQLTVDITDQVHLLGGGRFTHEEKHLQAFDAFTGAQQAISAPNLSSNSFSPEVTLSYEPMEKTNLFISYRKGTKSGAFNTTPTTPGPYGDLRYKDEKVQGFEAGVKSVLDEGQLRIDVSAFRYEYRDFQLGFFDSVSLAVNTANAGGATSKGIEWSTTYAPRTVPGLTLSGNVSYVQSTFDNDARGSCWTGQGALQGCDLTPVGGLFTNQSFAGKRLARAPLWSGNLSATYEHEISDNLRMGFSLAGDYKGSFNPVTELAPFTKQKGMLTLDGGVSVSTVDDRWKVELIGKNLTNKLRIQNGFSVPLSPDPAGVTAKSGTLTGGTPSDYFGYTNDPRSIQLRVTFQFFGDKK